MEKSKLNIAIMSNRDLERMFEASHDIINIIKKYEDEKDIIKLMMKYDVFEDLYTLRSLVVREEAKRLKKEIEELP